MRFATPAAPAATLGQCMEHQNTIPSVLGPMSGKRGVAQLPVEPLKNPEKPLLRMPGFWLVVALVAFGVFKFLSR
jgi:hypothetical protein